MPNNVPRALRHSGALDPGWTAQAFYHVYGCGMGSGSLIRADELLPARRHAGGETLAENFVRFFYKRNPVC